VAPRKIVSGLRLNIVLGSSWKKRCFILRFNLLFDSSVLCSLKGTTKFWSVNINTLEQNLRHLTFSKSIHQHTLIKSIEFTSLTGSSAKLTRYLNYLVVFCIYAFTKFVMYPWNSLTSEIRNWLKCSKQGNSPLVIYLPDTAPPTTQTHLSQWSMWTTKSY
jgi:hypothetical protein